MPVDLDECKLFGSQINYLGNSKSNLTLQIFSFDSQVFNLIYSY